MVFVCLQELVPEAHRHGFGDTATLGGLIGFAVMMTLDVALGWERIPRYRQRGALSMW
jgi:ZIP family zinc transporter